MARSKKPKINHDQTYDYDGDSLHVWVVRASYTDTFSNESTYVVGVYASEKRAKEKEAQAGKDYFCQWTDIDRMEVEL